MNLTDHAGVRLTHGKPLTGCETATMTGGVAELATYLRFDRFRVVGAAIAYAVAASTDQKALAQARPHSLIGHAAARTATRCAPGRRAPGMSTGSWRVDSKPKRSGEHEVGLPVVTTGCHGGARGAKPLMKKVHDTTIAR
jgi:hypothetical protein